MSLARTGAFPKRIAADDAKDTLVQKCPALAQRLKRLELSDGEIWLGIPAPSDAEAQQALRVLGKFGATWATVVRIPTK